MIMVGGAIAFAACVVVAGGSKALKAAVSIAQRGTPPREANYMFTMRSADFVCADYGLMVMPYFTLDGVQRALICDHRLNLCLRTYNEPKALFAGLPVFYGIQRPVLSLSGGVQ